MRFVDLRRAVARYLGRGGRRLPLLCLPGLTRNGADFDDLAAALGGRHRLIRLTLRGRGASDRDPDCAELQHRRRGARRASSSSTISGSSGWSIVGTSRGGLIAMMLGGDGEGRGWRACC